MATLAPENFVGKNKQMMLPPLFLFHMIKADFSRACCSPSSTCLILLLWVMAYGALALREPNVLTENTTSWNSYCCFLLPGNVTALLRCYWRHPTVMSVMELCRDRSSLAMWHFVGGCAVEIVFGCSLAGEWIWVSWWVCVGVQIVSRSFPPNKVIGFCDNLGGILHLCNYFTTKGPSCLSRIVWGTNRKVSRNHSFEGLFGFITKLWEFTQIKPVFFLFWELSNPC